MVGKLAKLSKRCISHGKPIFQKLIFCEKHHKIQHHGKVSFQHFLREIHCSKFLGFLQGFDVEFSICIPSVRVNQLFHLLSKSAYPLTNSFITTWDIEINEMVSESFQGWFIFHFFSISTYLVVVKFRKKLSDGHGKMKVQHICNSTLKREIFNSFLIQMCSLMLENIFKLISIILIKTYKS